MDFFLKLFNINATDARHLSGWGVSYHGWNPAWVLLLALALSIGVYFMYRLAAEHVSPGRRWLLTILRAGFLVLVLGLLLRPVLTVTFEQSVRRTVLLLFDNSSSMSQIKDQRSQTDDLKRVAIAHDLLDAGKGLSQSLDRVQLAGHTAEPRIEVVRSALKNPRIDLYPRLARDYDIEAYGLPAGQQGERALTAMPAASYKSRVVRADDRNFFQAYPYFMPIVLALAGIALVLAGIVTRAPYATYGGAAAMGLAVLWLLAGMALGLGSDKPKTVAASTTQPSRSLEQVRASLDTRWIDALQADGKSTPLGDAVREVISLKRGQPLAGIVLITDGASNAGGSPLQAARLAADDHVPLYIYGVGITSPRDIIVGRNVFAPEVAFARDEVLVSVRVEGRGMNGQTANLVVRMVPKGPGAPAAEERAEKTVTFNGEGEQVVTVALTPKSPGEFNIIAEVPPRDDEVVKDNNSASQPIRVIDQKIKVLLAEQYPRWEFKYAQAALLRDRRIDLKCFLAEADPDITRTKDSPYLPEFPRKKEDLFKYDLVILGDLDPKDLTADQVEMLHDFVSKFGGALVMVAGKRYSPSAWRRTSVEKMLPVELASIEVGQPPVASRPLKLELTPEGQKTPMLQIAPTELESLGRWTALPPIYWDAKVARAKPAAHVLVVDPDPSKGSQYGKMPVIAMQQFGAGQVMFIGTDNLWRFRKNVGDQIHAQLWGQIAQRMALPHLLGASKRTRLDSDRKEYTTGSPITIYARLYTENFEPVTQSIVKATMWDASGGIRSIPVELRPIPEQPGMYRGVVTAAAAGTYKLAVDQDRATEGDKATTLEIRVAEPNLELMETAMNQPLLEQMAAASGGQFFREEDLVSLPQKLATRIEKKPTTVDAEIAYSWAYLVLILAVVTTEWIVRKASQLK